MKSHTELINMCLIKIKVRRFPYLFVQLKSGDLQRFEKNQDKYNLNNNVYCDIAFKTLHHYLKALVVNAHLSVIVPRSSV